MGKRGKGGDKKGDGDLKEEEVLQAILLADSFSQAFRPVSLEIPKVGAPRPSPAPPRGSRRMRAGNRASRGHACPCAAEADPWRGAGTVWRAQVLMPVVNVPMIDYTLEWLGSQGVDEVFVFCSAHAAAVEQYLLESKWTVVPEGKKEEEAEVKNVWRRPVVHIERSDTCTSAGDALREIDGRGLIHSDPFVLVSGDVISNMNLKQVVDTHKQRRKADSSSIMTVVLKKARTMHPTRPLNDDLVVITDGTTGQMLVYEDDVEAPLVELLAERMQEHQSVAFRYDLLDTHVDVCSPEVLLHFSDNYDYQDVRRDYLRNEVRNAVSGTHRAPWGVRRHPPAHTHAHAQTHSCSLAPPSSLLPPPRRTWAGSSSRTCSRASTRPASRTCARTTPSAVTWCGGGRTRWCPTPTSTAPPRTATPATPRSPRSTCTWTSGARSAATA